MMSCGATRKARISEFKELTKDMRIKTHDEAKIAQVLYLKMIKNK